MELLMKKLLHNVFLCAYFFLCVAEEATIHHQQWQKDARIAHILQQAQASKSYASDNKAIEKAVNVIADIEQKLRDAKSSSDTNAVGSLERELISEIDALDGLLTQKFYANVTVFMDR